MIEVGRLWDELIDSLINYNYVLTTLQIIIELNMYIYNYIYKCTTAYVHAFAD